MLKIAWPISEVFLKFEQLMSTRKPHKNTFTAFLIRVFPKDPNCVSLKILSIIFGKLEFSLFCVPCIENIEDILKFENTIILCTDNFSTQIEI